MLSFLRPRERAARAGILVQARMGSKRLPGKALLPLGGKPVITQIVERLSGMPEVPVIVATSIATADDALARECKERGFLFTRGDEEDVLGRFLEAARRFKLKTVVRITGDSPLVDRGVIERMLAEFLSGDFDYYSNLRPRTMPRGFGCEIFGRTLLEKALSDRRPGDRGEYVVIPYLERHAGSLKLGNFRMEEDRSSLRLTLDEEADYELIRRVYDALYAKDPKFSYADVIRFMDQNPELVRLNAHVRSQNP